jgi:hypothetical protein
MKPTSTTCDVVDDPDHVQKNSARLTRGLLPLQRTWLAWTRWRALKDATGDNLGTGKTLIRSENIYGTPPGAGKLLESKPGPEKTGAGFKGRPGHPAPGRKAWVTSPAAYRSNDVVGRMLKIDERLALLRAT